MEELRKVIKEKYLKKHIKKIDIKKLQDIKLINELSYKNKISWEMAKTEIINDVLKIIEQERDIIHLKLFNEYQQLNKCS